METAAYAGAPEERFARFLAVYQSICARSIRVYIPFFISMIGEAFLISSTLELHGLNGKVSQAIALSIGGLPFFIFFVLTFCNAPPPVFPKTFRRLMEFSGIWYFATAISLVAVVFVANGVKGSTAIAFWICTALGSLGLPTLWQNRTALRQQENNG